LSAVSKNYVVLRRRPVTVVLLDHRCCYIRVANPAGIAFFVATTNITPSRVSNASNVFETLLPNPGRTKFVRGVVILFVAVGALAWLVLTARILSEFHARRSWPIAEGRVIDVRVKSYTGPSSKDHISHYFVEYEVRFGVPIEQCLTGTTFVFDGQPARCEGIARTRTTDSQALANSWAERHRLDPSVGVLHNPNGPDVKIAGEPVYLVYPWKEISVMSAWMIFFLTLLIITQRRLQYLETLPENYGAT
jgi:hypothetical protein